jgi:hypothetical protein
MTLCSITAHVGRRRSCAATTARRQIDVAESFIGKFPIPQIYCGDFFDSIGQTQSEREAVSS